MMEAEDRIMKTKIKIVNGNPFFAYLSLYLNIEEDKVGRIPKDCGMAVNPEGRLWYRKEFIDSITDAELLGVVKHEILHLALLHLVRIGRRHNFKWNISTDLVANTMLLANGDELPKGLRPNQRNEFVVVGKIITEIDKKSAEEIYDELPEIPETKVKVFISWDNHETSKGDKKEEELTEAELQNLETDWFNKVKVAMLYAQQRGQLPKGLERYVDKLKEAEINWRVTLMRYIQKHIPTDYTWSQRSKKSNALGIYLPNTIKDKITGVVSVDTSGSIEELELTKFISEILSIARTFRETIDMRIMFHDVDVQGDYFIKNGSIPQIMAMKIKGGGGTSHKPLFKKINEEVKDCRFVVCFTDGCSDIEDIKLDKYKFDKMFIINKKGIIPQIKKGSAIIIKLKGD